MATEDSKTDILLIDAIAVILGVQFQASKPTQAIISKAIPGVKSSDDISFSYEVARNEHREVIGDWVTIHNVSVQNKQKLSLLLEQQYPGITDHILEFGKTYGIESGMDEVDDIVGQSRQVKRTQYYTTVAANSGKPLKAVDGKDIPLFEGVFRERVLNGIYDFLRTHNYPETLNIDVSSENLVKIEQDLPSLERRFVPILEVENPGIMSTELKKPMNVATFQNPEVSIACPENAGVLASYRQRQ